MNKLFALISILLVAFISLVSLNYSIKRSDESIHSAVAQEMANFDGTLVNPKFFGTTYLNKPPLQIFLTSRLIKLFGDENFVYRIIPALCGIGSAILLILISNSYFGSLIPGIFAVLCMASGRQIFFDHGIRVGVQDSALLFGVLLTIFGFLKEKRLLVFLGTFVGTSVKWISGLLPAFFILLWALYERRRIPIFSIITGVAPVFLFLGYHLATDFESTIGTLKFNISERLIGEGHHNQEDFFLYFRNLFLRSSYGSSWMIFLGLLSIFNFKKTGALFLWGSFGLVILSFLSSRLPWYLFPVVPSFWLMFGYVAWRALIFSKKFMPLTFLLILIFSLRDIAPILKRAVNDNKIENIDLLVQRLKNIPVRLEGINPMIDGSGGLSRRQLFYLRRLKIDQNADLALATPEYDRLFDAWSKQECINNENKKEKIVFCLFKKLPK